MCISLFSDEESESEIIILSNNLSEEKSIMGTVECDGVRHMITRRTMI